MRAPLLSRGALKLQVSKKASYQAPIGGMNTRDPLSSLKDNEAWSIDNMFCNTGYLEQRYASTEYSTGLTGTGKTLATFSSLSGTETMFCTTASGIYDVTSSGAVGASVLARTNGKHQIVTMGDGTNNWLMLFNGVDKPAYYNGTAWTAVDNASVPALTGVTTTALIGGMSFKGRLILIESGKLKFWYLAAGAVGGALNAFDLTAQASGGGYLMACTNWTMDGGSGMDDRAVFVTSEGEVIVYAGTDPATAADWQKVGTYFVGKPIGRKCLCKYGGDVLILTENGIVSLAAIVSGIINQSKYKISDKIQGTYIGYAQQYKSNFGWDIFVYPKENALIVNVPAAEDGTHYQLLMNITTGAWSRFNGWNAESFGILDSQLYYTRSTKTAKAWNRSSTSQTDETGNGIQGGYNTAFFKLGTGNRKTTKMAMLTSYMPSASFSVALSMYKDYNVVSSISGSTSFKTMVSGQNTTWYPACAGTGFAFSFAVVEQSPGSKWYALDVIYQDGGPL